MARKPTPTADIKQDPVTPELSAALSQTQEVVAALQGAHSDERDLVNQLLGQAQMADAFGKFSQTVWASKLAFVKENKLYKAIAGQKTPNGLELKGSWEDFCSLLGISDEKANQDIANLKAFGESALESMSRMGIGYREMRQYRRLPEDEKTALIEIAKSGDKEALVEFAETIFEKHSKEKQASQEKFTELEKEHQTQGEILAEAKQEALSLKAELKKLKPGTTMWENAIVDLKAEITSLQSFIDESVARQDEAIDAIDSWLTTHVVNQPGYDPESPFVMPAQALTVLMHLDECINRSAHLIAAARQKLHNEFGADLAAARQHLLIDSEE